MTLFTLMALSFFICFTIMSIGWWTAKRIDNFSIVDVLWAYCFTLLAPLIVVLSPGALERKLLFGSAILVWSFRLGTHLATRIFSHLDEEDSRYRQLRTEYGSHVALRFFLFYQMQAASVVFLLIPFYITAANESALIHPLEILGGVFFLIGISGESLADHQLKKFKKNRENAGKVCDQGLWNYSRHPNYFFEAVIWLGYGVFALGSPNGHYALIASIAMWTLLLKVTGVPMAEAQSLKSKGDLYREYQRTTNMFFPGPKKSS